MTLGVTIIISSFLSRAIARIGDNGSSTAFHEHHRSEWIYCSSETVG